MPSAAERPRDACANIWTDNAIKHYKRQRRRHRFHGWHTHTKTCNRYQQMFLEKTKQLFLFGAAAFLRWCKQLARSLLLAKPGKLATRFITHTRLVYSAIGIIAQKSRLRSVVFIGFVCKTPRMLILLSIAGCLVFVRDSSKSFEPAMQVDICCLPIKKFLI